MKLEPQSELEFRSQYLGKEIPIPGALNLLIFATSILGSVALLWFCAHAPHWSLSLLAAVAFSFVNNTNFSMLHEAVHRVAHPNRTINDGIGIVTAAFFPTGFLFQRACHLSHHRRNRTDHEMFDQYYPDDWKFLKFLQLYFVVGGVYWTNPGTGALLYLATPKLLNLPLLRNRQSKIITHMGADAMISAILKTPPVRTRLEILFTIVVQLTLFFGLGLTFWSWLACYWAFAMNWGGLQYADHAWSTRDVRNGAWNLRVPRWIEAVFLHYHHHLAHHQHPNVPWVHLSKFVDFNSERPTFWSIYKKLWRGPTPATEPAPKSYDPELDTLLL